MVTTCEHLRNPLAALAEHLQVTHVGLGRLLRVIFQGERSDYRGSSSDSSILFDAEESVLARVELVCAPRRARVDPWKSLEPPVYWWTDDRVDDPGRPLFNAEGLARGGLVLAGKVPQEPDRCSPPKLSCDALET
jgi:hypothetical protein